MGSADEAHINEANTFSTQIDDEINSITRYVRKNYISRFPELDSIVPDASQFCKAMIEIESAEKDSDPKQWFAYLGPHQRISLTVALAASRRGLTDIPLSEIISAAREVNLLQQHKQLELIYLESCMQNLAPSLCKLLGSAVASKLINAASGLQRLAMTPACNIQVMGGRKETAAVGIHLEGDRPHTGVFMDMDLVKNAPKRWQMQIVRMFATNAAKCARIDYLRSNDGSLGIKLREELLDRFAKVQEEGGTRALDKPLAIPDMKPQKRRGGKKHRRLKELTKMSELRKAQNRLQFGEAEQVINDLEGIAGNFDSEDEEGDELVGLGMSKGAARAAFTQPKRKLKVSKAMQKRIDHTIGIESSVDLAGQDGIQLVNPQRLGEQKGTDSYFHQSAGFQTVINRKLQRPG